MRDRRRMVWLGAGAASAAALAVLLVLLVGDGEEPATPTAAEPPAAETGVEREEAEPAAEERADGAGGGGERPDRSPPDPDDLAELRAERSSKRTYRAYVRAINRRDGEALCELLEPGAVEELRPPIERGSCAQRLSRSIGFADERGFPVWERTVLSGFESTLIGEGGGVQLTAATVTRFADRKEPSVESDVAYLLPAGGERYLLAKASGILWRAVGKPDVPPQVISAPPGF